MKIFRNFKLLCPAQYQIRENKLEVDLTIVLYGCVAGIIIVLIGIGIYIVTKKDIGLVKKE